jgi:hypothetical protein
MTPRIAAGALLIAAACTSDTRRTAANDTAVAPIATHDSILAGFGKPPPAMQPAGEMRPDSIASVTVHGVGPLRVGMTLAEARKALGGALVIPRGADTLGCDYVTWRGGPRGLHVMIDEGRIARVDVDSTSLATAAGARVGDSEERIRRLYPGRVAVTPHKYEDGHYLTVNAAGDSSFAIVFETAKGRVTRYRAGRRPAVEYVEGCS